MTTPYRELYVEPARPRAETELGRCPWCHVRVEWKRGDRRAVCGACGARYATAQALIVDDDREEPTTERTLALRRVGRDVDLSTFGPVAWRVGLGMVAFVGMVMLAAISSAPGVILALDFTTVVIALLVNLVRRTMA